MQHQRVIAKAAIRVSIVEVTEDGVTSRHQAWSVVHPMLVGEVSAHTDSMDEAIEMLTAWLGGKTGRARVVYVRCPGCGDRGDAEHVAACAGARIDTAWNEGGMYAVEIAKRMANRRRWLGAADLVGVLAGVRNTRSARRRWGRRRG